MGKKDEGVFHPHYMVDAPSWSRSVIVMTNFCKSNLKEPVKTELLLSH